MNYVSDISRKLDYITVAGSRKGKEAVMFIYRERIKGRGFAITQDAMWKYMEPNSYKGDEQARKADAEDFLAMGRQFAKEYYQAQQSLAHGHLLCDVRKEALERRTAAEAMMEMCKEAVDIANGNGYYLCVAFNLIVCMRGLEITPCKKPRQAAAQLLLWIQSKLPDLQLMPEYDPSMDHDPKYTEGHIEVKLGGEVMISKDIEISESQLIERENSMSGMN